jgi:hypothetical protein
MPVIILGGVFSGIFTATEAAAVAVLYALLVGLLVTRALKLASTSPAVFLKSALMTSGVLLIVSMASIFANLLTVLQVPQTLAAYLTGLTQDPTMILILLTLFVLICGLFIDTLPAVIVLTPILAPIAFLAGIDPLHFATLFIVALVLGMITPPVGPVLFVVSPRSASCASSGSRAPSCRCWWRSSSSWGCIVAFPAISLWVPRPARTQPLEEEGAPGTRLPVGTKVRRNPASPTPRPTKPRHVLRGATPCKDPPPSSLAVLALIGAATPSTCSSTRTSSPAAKTSPSTPPRSPSRSTSKRTRTAPCAWSSTRQPARRRRHRPAGAAARHHRARRRPRRPIAEFFPPIELISTPYLFESQRSPTGCSTASSATTSPSACSTRRVSA